MTYYTPPHHHHQYHANMYTAAYGDHDDFYPHGPPHPAHVYSPVPAPPPHPMYYDHRNWYPGSGSYRGGSGGFGGGFYKNKPGYNNRKISTDSGFSVGSVSTVGTMDSEDLEEDNSPYEKPDDDLCEKIVEQVEFYFSDANITRDKFLLKHVRRNKEGFVSLKLVASFKRVKHLTKDWRQVTEAVERKSSRLAVNDIRTKVRRTEPLPAYDETAPSRTVVAVNLPLERPTIEGVAEIFSACGEIVLIRILRPGNPIPADIRPFLNRHPDLVDMACAVVEFEVTAHAHIAVKELNGLNSVEGKMMVMELTEPAKPRATLTMSIRTEHVDKNEKPAPRRRFSHAGLVILPQKQNPDDLFLGPRNATVSPPTSAGAQPRRRISLYHDMKFSAVNEEAAAQDNKEEKTASDNNGSPGLNPNAPSFRCFTRSLRKVGTAASAGLGLSLPPNVIRMPRGPDKESGKGFFVRRKTSKANEEIKEETEDEEDVEEGKCVASASAEVEEKDATKENEAAGNRVTFSEAPPASITIQSEDSGNEEEFEEVDLAAKAEDDPAAEEEEEAAFADLENERGR